MTKSIDWNEVTVGETEIANPKGRKFLVICIHDGDAWLYDPQAKYHFDRTIKSLKDWILYDPWEEITNDIIFKRSFMRNMEVVQHLTFRCYAMSFNDAVIDPDDPNFKVDGRRVWKRKEGRDE